jgi:hypothetical protein
MDKEPGAYITYLENCYYTLRAGCANPSCLNQFPSLDTIKSNFWYNQVIYCKGKCSKSLKNECNCICFLSGYAEYLIALISSLHTCCIQPPPILPCNFTCSNITVEEEGSPVTEIDIFFNVNNLSPSCDGATYCALLIVNGASPLVSTSFSSSTITNGSNILEFINLNVFNPSGGIVYIIGENNGSCSTNLSDYIINPLSSFAFTI